MITQSDKLEAEQALEHLEAQERHNESQSICAMVRSLERVAHVAIDDPVVREARRQKQIIDKALIALRAKDTAKARQLLEQL